MLMMRRATRHEEHRVLERLRAVGLLGLARGVVQEHEVEVRAVAELEAAELAVGDDAELRVARRAVHDAARPPVPRAVSSRNA